MLWSPVRCYLQIFLTLYRVRPGIAFRTKRFRSVSEQKNRGMGFSVLIAREMKREPKNERAGRWRGRKETFLSSPPLPALLLAPFFARSWTLVPRSLLLNRTETLATQAKPGTERSVKSLLTLQILFADQRLVCQCGYEEIHAGKINAACFKAGQGCPHRLHNISKEQKRIDIN